MTSIEALKNKTDNICVVGLGYVGLPLAIELAKHFSIIGFDINEKRIAALKESVDTTGELSSDQLSSVSINYTNNSSDIADAKVIIVAVPTPITKENKPDLTILKLATETVGANLADGAVVVYESTVYPGVTEDVCVPILEEKSGNTVGEGFSVGYSPERINPGDKEHTIDKITKVVAGYNNETVDLLADLYGAITKTFKASSIKVAEAAKVIENTQRDLNIALINELAVIFNKMNIDTYDVLEAAGTKWNFLKFTPGLVGGHCIGVDPYYLTHKAQELGFDPDVILAGRKTNDSMHEFVAKEIVRIASEKNIEDPQVVIFGMTFKENISDIRNSRVVELYEVLKTTFAKTPVVYDPNVDAEEVKHEYGIDLVAKDSLPKADILIVAVSHDEFMQMTPEMLHSFMNHDNVLLIDIKHMYNRLDIEEKNITYWSL
jgi:UDP-N-acetyl-D-glucosamine/UDP-N-acetyl-D-galactosamine dehydrogenase